MEDQNELGGEHRQERDGLPDEGNLAQVRQLLGKLPHARRGSRHDDSARRVDANLGRSYVQGAAALPPDDHIERDRALAEVVERVDIAAAQREVVRVLRALPSLRVEKRIYKGKAGAETPFRG